MMGLQFWFTAPILDDEPQCGHSNDQDDDECEDASNN